MPARIVHQDERAGVLHVELTPTFDGKIARLIVEYPPFYPFTRFEVLAPDWNLVRHQNPYLKNLCLIGRAPENWDVDITAADLIASQVPQLIVAANTPDIKSLAGIEEQQGEPITAFQQSLEHSLVLIDSNWHIDGTSGELLIGYDLATDKTFRGAVLEVRSNHGDLLAEAAPGIRRRFDQATERARWFRIDQEIREQNARQFLEQLSNKHGAARKPRPKNFGGRQIDIIATIFPEELTWGEHGDGWVFTARTMQERPGFRTGTYFNAAFLRTGRAGEEDFLFRAPELAQLAKHKIALVGLGCLGAPSALEFARAGVGDLRIMDNDIVEPPTVMRWPFGLVAAGRHKATVIAEYIQENYPYTTVTPLIRKIGAPTDMDGIDLGDAQAFFADCTLIYDATADRNVHYLLSTLARDLGVPYIAISGSPGGWGGTLLRLRPESTAPCWVCYQYACDGDEPLIPGPPEDPEKLLQAPGCAEPTFTGAAFDLLNTTLAGVRLAVGTLTGSYPDVPYDVAVLSLRNEAGHAIAPLWTTFVLETDSRCRSH